MIRLPLANPLFDVVRIHDFAIQNLSHEIGKFFVAGEAEGNQLPHRQMRGARR